ncbi:MAG: tripartite tricarboxylate transporter TctB family protein [Burkholderiales bacterium]|nr:tripartite tricarboxylate transporter TctB family protein [Burkholderiales bacterium]MDP2399060.1 tripartite tricarboxylate transporter TctB family protein [Burkholderiales bacterium]
MTDRIIFVCALLLAGVYFWGTAQIPSLELGDPLGPKAFPRMLGVGLLIAAAMLLAEILNNRKKAVTDGDDSGGFKWEPHDWVVLGVVAWTALYIVLFEPLGYMLATLIYLLVLTGYFNRGRHLMNSLSCVLFVAISYFAFTKLLGVNLARGIIPF